jgi:PAS domain S-box-containing protein
LLDLKTDFDKFLNISFDSAIIIDRNKKIIDFNDKFLKLFNYTKCEIENKTIEEIFFINNFKLNQNFNEDKEFIIRGKLKNSYVNLKFSKFMSKDKVKIVNIRRIYDLDRDKNESQDSFYKLIVDDLESLIAVVDEDYKYVYVNSRYKEFFNIREDHIKKFFIKDTIKEDIFINDIRPNINKVLSGKKINIEKWIVNANNKKRYINCVFEKLKHGNLNYVVMKFKDITDRKKIEEALILARKMADSAYNVKNLFLANISHEFKTPINGIRGMVQLLNLTNLNEEQKSYTKMLEESTDRISILIENILEFSKIDSKDFTLIEKKLVLDDFINQDIATYKKRAIDKKLSFSLFIDENIPKILLADRKRLKQIFSNVLDNAIKFCETGGIFIEIEREFEDDLGVGIKINVRDSGKGIKKEKLNYVFNIFAKEDESNTSSNGGVGLGLAITKEIVNFLGGDIRIESKENLGTSVFISLYLKKFLDIKKEKEIYKINKEMKILIVEDDKVNEKALKLLLEKNNFKVKTASNGLQAIDIIKMEDMDIILMDIKLPDINGFEITKKIRKIEKERKSYTPIIAVTSLDDSKFLNKALKAGMDDFLEKPFKIEKIYNKINKLYDKKIHYKNTNDPDLKQAFAFSNNDKNLFMDLVYILLNTDYIKDNLNSIRSALENYDEFEVKKIAKSLKEGIITFGAKKAYELAFELENLERRELKSKGINLYFELEEELNRVIQIYKTIKIS